MHAVALPVLPREPVEPVRGELAVRYVGKKLVLAPGGGVDVEVGYDGALPAQVIEYQAGGVHGLAGAGSAGVQVNHGSTFRVGASRELSAQTPRRRSRDAPT